MEIVFLQILLMFSQSTGETHELLGAFLSEIIRTTLQVVHQSIAYR